MQTGFLQRLFHASRRSSGRTRQLHPIHDGGEHTVRPNPRAAPFAIIQVHIKHSHGASSTLSNTTNDHFTRQVVLGCDRARKAAVLGSSLRRRGLTRAERLRWDAEMDRVVADAAPVFQRDVAEATPSSFNFAAISSADVAGFTALSIARIRPSFPM